MTNLVTTLSEVNEFVINSSSSNNFKISLHRHDLAWQSKHLIT